jgi:hypothetical protein
VAGIYNEGNIVVGEPTLFELYFRQHSDMKWSRLVGFELEKCYLVQWMLMTDLRKKQDQGKFCQLRIALDFNRDEGSTIYGPYGG